MEQIDILLATYNGERFLEEQLDSLFAQSFPHFRLIIRDDLSSDETPKIIQKYAQRHADKIHVVPAHSQLGAKGNFSELMTHSTAPYVMFCDQDDIWLPSKIERTLEVMEKLHQVHPDQPLLVHTDLKIINEKGSEISHSFWDYTNINPNKFFTTNRFLTQNVVTGCTLMINRSLCDLAYPIPNECFMHDWWIALVASALGKIGVLNEPTILYRQHASNTLGAQKFGCLQHLKQRLANLNEHDATKQKQAHILLARYAERLTHPQKVLISNYLGLQEMNLIKNRYLCFKHGFYKSGFARNLISFLTKKQP